MEPKEQIRSAIDVVDLVGEYLTLKKAGQGSFKALCPFHGEKTPSLYVHRSKQIWHCFGCDKGGDIFAFVMEMEGVEFPEALRLLGKKAGVEIPQFERRDMSTVDRLKAINAFAQKVYERFLQTEKGSVARAYLERRGITPELQMAFGLGYAPDAWTTLIDVAKKKHITDADLQAAGLALPSKRGNRIDRFRHRLMIPLRDHRGDTVGFTARALREGDTPKYMNSPQTEIYDKSALVYGLDIAKSAIKSAGEVILVEGNLDVVASHKAGVKHVVAVSGTALTEHHVRLLKRYATRFVFCFDADDAGFHAAVRGMRLARSLGADVRVVALARDMGKDPDEVVQKDPELWHSLVTKHVDQLTFMFDRIVAPIDRKDVSQKKQAGAAFLDELRPVQDTIEREHWLKRLAEVVDVSMEELRKALEKQRGVTPRASSRGVDVSFHVAKERTLPTNPSTSSGGKVTANSRGKVTLDDLFIAHIVNDEAAFKLAASRIAPDALSDESAKHLYKLALSLYPTANTSSKSFFEALHKQATEQSESLARQLTRCAMLLERQDASSNQSDATPFSQILSKIEDRVVHSKRQEILSALREAQRAQDVERMEALTRQYQALL